MMEKVKTCLTTRVELGAKDEATSMASCCSCRQTSNQFFVTFTSLLTLYFIPFIQAFFLRWFDDRRQRFQRLALK
jgi:hypothetical protein